MKKSKKIVIFIICIGFLLVGFFGGKYLYSLHRYKTIISELRVENVDLSKISDGKYIGSCDADFVGAKVSVTVKDHKITDIVLIEHKTEKGKPAEVIPAMVVKSQSLDVDTISGATNSSKVILEAISNALKSKKK